MCQKSDLTNFLTVSEHYPRDIFCVKSFFYPPLTPSRGGGGSRVPKKFFVKVFFGDNWFLTPPPLLHNDKGDEGDGESKEGEGEGEEGGEDITMAGQPTKKEIQGYSGDGPWKTEMSNIDICLWIWVLNLWGIFAFP